METQVVDTEKVTIRPITKKTAKDIIEKHHYTHNFSSCRYSLGVYYKKENVHKFLDTNNEELIGCIVYGHPVGSLAVNSISEELEFNNVLELTRLFIFDGYGKNIESFVISQSFRWLKKNAPNIKVLISYADPEQSHLGIIYQATNWNYQGIGYSKLMPSYSIRLTENGEWIHSRTVGSKFQSRNIEHLKRVIGKTFWRKEESSKHRYLYFLCDKREKKRLVNSLKYPPMKYPKDTEQFKPVIETIMVINKELQFCLN